MTILRTPHLRGLVLSATGMVVISPDGLLLRLIDTAGPWEIILYRSSFMGIGLALVLALRHGRRVGGLWCKLGWAGLASAVLMAGANMGFIGAITHTTVANTLVILAAMPLISAVLGRLLIGEAVARRTWGAIIVAMGGIVVIFADSLGGGAPLGDGLAAVTAVLMGLNLVLLRRMGPRDVLPMLCLAGFLGAAAAAFFAEPTAVSGRDLAIIAVLGFVVLPLALALFFGGVRFVPAAEVALLALLETVLAPIWVWLGVGERPSAAAMVGGVIVVGAVIVNAVLGLRPPGPPQSEAARRDPPGG